MGSTVWTVTRSAVRIVHLSCGPASGAGDVAFEHCAETGDFVLISPGERCISDVDIFIAACDLAWSGQARPAPTRQVSP